MKNERNKIIKTVKERISKPILNEPRADQIDDKQVAVLLGELQIAQLELEMQNDELSMSAQLLETERARFAGFFNLAPVGYFILDHIGIVQEANQVGLNMLHLSKSKFIGQRFQSVILSACWEKFYHFLHQMHPGGVKRSAEITIHGLDGRGVYTRMEGIALKNESGQPEYYIGIIDITESKEAQQRLEETTQRLALTLQASGTGTWNINLNDNSIFLDPYCLLMLEVHPWDFTGTINDFLMIVDEKDRQFVRNYLIACKQQKNVDFEFGIKTANGAPKIIAVQGNLVQMRQSQPHFVGIMIDITKKKEIQRVAEQLENEKKQLILSATFTAQEKERDRISSALHDSICQLLYGIRLKIQNVQLDHQLPAEFKEVHELLAEAIKETRELSYELTPSVLRDFGFKEAIKEMSNRLGNRNFKINVVVQGNVDLLSNDVQFALFRMVQELLNNSAKHAGASNVKVTIKARNNQVLLQVADNGQGFKEDTETTLINGSGLRGIKNRAFLLNGEVAIESSEKGTKVTVKFSYN
jgi:PAS domain S-box-containing protein